MYYGDAVNFDSTDSFATEANRFMASLQGHVQGSAISQNLHNLQMLSQNSNKRVNEQSRSLVEF